VVDDTFRVEKTSAYVYRRDRMDPWILAQNQYSLIIKADDLQQLTNPLDVSRNEIQSTNPGAITRIRTSVGATPLRGDDWWVFPGQQVKLPSFVMEKLTDSSTIVERKLTLEHRIRFNSTSIHRYDFKTLKRDAAMAYFAGVREVLPFTSTYIPGEDKPVFEFSMYDSTQWVLNNIRQIEAGPVSCDCKTYRIPNPSFDQTLTNWIASPGDGGWIQDRRFGHYALGSAAVPADNRDKDLKSALIQVEPGEILDMSAWTKWKDLVVTNGEAGMTLGVVCYLDGEETERVTVDQVDFATWSAHANSTSEPDVSASGFVEMTGNYAVPPSGVDAIRVLLGVTSEATSGAVWFDLVTIEDGIPRDGTVYKNFQTQSDFSKALVEFRDTGLIRSDSMWADINPDSGSIDDTTLAYYTNTIPATVPGGMWGDEFKAWGADAEWGSPFAIVSITLDGNRRYQGNRVVHFTRKAGAGEAGIQVRQFTNWVPLALARIGCVFYKPFANTNQMTLRLRRMSDGVFVYEETVDAPAGRWVDYQTKFFEIPDTPDQEYMLMMTLDGDEEDELYLSDLYCDIGRIRYFVRLGGVGAPLHEVSDLRYVQGYAQVVAQQPVNEMSVQAAILSPEAWAYGCTIQPAYLK
jgi:hypothetical protein